MSEVKYGWMASEIANSPGLAIDASKEVDPAGASELLMHAQNGVRVQDSLKNYEETTGTKGFWGKMGEGIYKPLEFLNKPLEEIKRDYRFIHSVYANHGVAAGLQVSMGSVLGGAAGFAVGGIPGAMLGSSAGSAVARKAFGSTYQDSYNDSENHKYRVSPGRDASNLFANISDAIGADGIAEELRITDKQSGKIGPVTTNFGSKGSIVSGIVDAAFSLRFDPIGNAGILSSFIRSGRFLKVTNAGKEAVIQSRLPISKIFPEVTDWLGAHSRRIFTPDQFDAVTSAKGLTGGVGRDYRRATDQMIEFGTLAKAKKLSDGSLDIYSKIAGQVAVDFVGVGPKAALRIASIVGSDMPKTMMKDKIDDLMRNSLYFGQLADNLNGASILPSRTLMRMKVLTPMQKKLRGDDLSKSEMNWINKGYNTFSGYMPFSVDPVTHKLTIDKFRFDSPDSAQVVYRIARFGGSHGWALEQVGRYSQAAVSGDILAAKKIMNEINMDSFKAMGLPDDHKLILGLQDEMIKLNSATMASRNYGIDINQNVISGYKDIDGNWNNAGIWDHQISREIQIPDYRQTKLAVRQAGFLAKAMAAGDQGAVKTAFVNTINPFYKGVANLDEWLVKSYTNKIFKPLALLTLGFGLRVAVSEMIPAVVKYGLLPTINVKTAAIAAKLGYDLIPSEVEHVAEAMYVALGASKGIEATAIKTGFPTFKSAIAKGMAKVTPEAQLDYAIELIIANRGHIVSEGASTTHGMNAIDANLLGDSIAAQAQTERWKTDTTLSPAEKSNILSKDKLKEIIKNKGNKTREVFNRELKEWKRQTGKSITVAKKDDFGTFTIDSPHFLPTLGTSLSKGAKNSAQVAIAKDMEEVLTGLTKVVYSRDVIGTGFGDAQTAIRNSWRTKFTAKSRLDLTEQKNLDSFNLHYKTKYQTQDEAIEHLNLLDEAAIKKRKIAIRSQAEGPSGAVINRALKAENELKVARDNWRNKLSEYTKATPEEQGALDAFNLQNDTNFLSGDDVLNHLKDQDMLAMSPTIVDGNATYLRLRNILIDREFVRMNETVDGTSKLYQNEARLGTRWSRQDIRAFAEQRIDAQLGLLIGQDGTVHMKLIKNMARGKNTNLDVLSSIDPLTLPKAVAGNQMETVVNMGQGIHGALNYVIQGGFDKVLSPLINLISREPLYLLHYADERESLKWMVANGNLRLDQAVRISQYRATVKMLPMIHNTALRTQFSMLMQNFAPFWFAQEQAMKRALYIANETSIPLGGPALSASYRTNQLAEQTMNNTGFVTKDAYGNKYIHLPGVGAFGAAIQDTLVRLGVPMVGKLPISVMGNTSSLKSVFPEAHLPGFGPVLTIPLNLLAQWFPILGKPVKSVVGSISYQQDMMGSVASSKVFNRLWDALGPDKQNDALVNATIGALVAAYAAGQVPGETASPADMKNFNDRIKNNAKSILLMKAGVGLLSPLTPAMQFGDNALSLEFRNMTAPVSEGGEGLDYTTALYRFLGEHGNNKISYTIGKSASTVKGTRLPYNKAALSWIKSNSQPGGLLDNPNTSTGAIYLIPQAGDKVDSNAMREQLTKSNLTKRLNVDELLTAMYVAEGYQEMQPDIKENNRLMALYEASSDTYSARLQRAKWAEYMAVIKNSKPIWYESYTSNVGRLNAAKALSQLQGIFADNTKTPTTEHANSVGVLLNEYNTYKNTLVNYESSGLSGYLVDIEKNRWEKYLENLEISDPSLANIIQSVFKKVG